VLIHTIAASALTLSVLGADREPTQGSPPQMIDRIAVAGNYKTKDFVILRELYYGPGDTLSDRILTEGIDRLRNIGIFADVNYTLTPTEDASLVTVGIEVIERPSWYLIPSFHWDRRKDKNHPLRGISVGSVIRNINMRGEAQIVQGGATIGARETLELAWYTPWVGRSPTSVGARTYREKTENRDTRQEEILARAEVGLNRRVTKYHSIGFNTSFEEFERRSLDSPSVDDQYTAVATPSLRVAYDSRDLHICPGSGSLLRTSVGHSRDWRTGRYNFTTYSLDLRHFRTIWGEHTVAAGVFTIVRRGIVPGYRKVRIGGGNTVRGWPEAHSSGIHSLVGTIEYRTPVLAEWRYNLPRRQQLDFSVVSHLFIDAGMAWSDSPFEERPLIGFGLGLRLLVPYRDAIRIDYAWDSHLRGRLHVAKGIKI